MDLLYLLKNIALLKHRKAMFFSYYYSGRPL